MPGLSGAEGESQVLMMTLGQEQKQTGASAFGLGVCYLFLAGVSAGQKAWLMLSHFYILYQRNVVVFPCLTRFWWLSLLLSPGVVQ